MNDDQTESSYSDPPPQAEIWQPPTVPSSGVWPPPANIANGVWPPPTNEPYGVSAVFPFKWLYLRVTGLVSDARQGEVVLAPEGIVIRGKAAPVAEISTPVKVASFVFCHLGGLVVAELVLQYACLRPIEWYIPWSDVQQIVFDAKKPRAGIVYNFPDRKGRIRTFTLVGSFIPVQFEQFKMMSQSRLGPAADVGVIKGGTSTLVIVLVLAIILSFVGIIVYASLNQGWGSGR